MDYVVTAGSTAGFTVTAAELLYAANKCRETNEQVQIQIVRMQTYVLELMGSYTGTAAVALAQLSEQWGADSKQLNFVLSTIADGLTSNAHNYVESETLNTANMTNIASSLPAAKF